MKGIVIRILEPAYTVWFTEGELVTWDERRGWWKNSRDNAAFGSEHIEVIVPQTDEEWDLYEMLYPGLKGECQNGSDKKDWNSH